MALTEPYKVRLVPYRKNLGKIMFRQTKGGKGYSSDGRYRFYIDEEIDEPDFWVIQGKGIRISQTCTVAPQNTLLLSTEPQSVLVYPQHYIKQFGTVFSCQQNTKHPNLILGPAVLPWFVGYHEDAGKTCTYTLDYDKLSQSPTPEKTKLISVITSNKAVTKGHIQRIRFVEKLKEHYGDKIDIFGRGYNGFADKWEVLAPYKYHIALENSSQPYYWTEKISDCYLSETFPFYYGCTNLNDYFSPEAFEPIDIGNFERTVQIIDRCITDNIYEQRKDVLTESKNLVLNKYNMFDCIAALCDKMNTTLPKVQVTIKPCHTMLNWQNFYRYNFLRNYYKWKEKLRHQFGKPSTLGL